MKEASGSIAQAAALARLCGDELAIYSGNDDMTLPILALGGQGVISVAANVCPGRVAALCQRFFAGDVAGARAIQLQLLPLIEALFIEVNPIPVKAALAMLGLCGEETRLPLVPASPETRKKLRDALAELEEGGGGGEGVTR